MFLVTFVTLMLSTSLAWAGTVVWPDGTVTQSFTNQRGVTTILPQVGLPAIVYPAPKAGDPATIILPSGQPVFVYPDSKMPEAIMPTMPSYAPVATPAPYPSLDLAPRSISPY